MHLWYLSNRECLVIPPCSVSISSFTKLWHCGIDQLKDIGFARWMSAGLSSICFEWRKLLLQLCSGFGNPGWGSVSWRFHSVLGRCLGFMEDQQGVCSGVHSSYNGGLGIPQGSTQERQEVSYRSKRLHVAARVGLSAKDRYQSED